ncbi:MAG: type II toxin-antitoxin system HicB family antitoxin [Gammaproteobacteria bacterium]|nr:type II toxin-antitoxin system HicB family antitoxin [Gammaproteobacteria bacterium]MBU1653887.1 type II toxin-antitoxin system HicB family antitoxin [Gammaproteobacteria bacterium]MBU1962599.1 type II toxin-antitoxin system HicB family antitoxin [Gammaproteobacteria bacterium]
MSNTSVKYTFWKDENMWLGYLDEFPDYLTQGETEEELMENLIDIYKEVNSARIPVVRRHGELHVA